MKHLIFGCGYLGARVARCWLARGDHVSAVTRSQQRAQELEQAGIEPIVGDIGQPGALPALPAADTVLFAVGHDRAPGSSIRQLYVTGLRRALAALTPATGRFIYISSTGVFGQTDAEWVDEWSRCQPVREGGWACLEAERELQAHPLGERSIILRLAGLYGPGRIPRRQEIQSGQPLAVPVDGYLNLIHVEDAAEVVLAAEQRAELPELFIVSDGHPVPRRDYYAAVAELLGAAAPQFITPDASTPAAQRAQSSKRVSNERMRCHLQVTLKYPTYRDGLASSIRAEAMRGSDAT